MKEFLKPTKGKIILTLLIFLFLPVFPNLVRVMCESKIGAFGGCSNYTEYVSLLAIMLSKYISWKDLSFSIIPIFGLIGAYVLSSVIIHLYNKIFPETKRGIKENLKPTKSRMIISVLGWISVGMVFMHYLSGVYGGTSNFSPALDALYGIFELLGVILLPFMLTSWYVFFTLDIVLFSLLGAFSKISIGVISGGLQPEYLTGFGALLIFPLLVIEWYVLSCAIMYIYSKLRKPN